MYPFTEAMLEDRVNSELSNIVEDGKTTIYYFLLSVSLLYRLRAVFC